MFCLAWAFLLLFAGAAVTSTRSGDAIPSWPMPLFPRDFGTPALIEWSHRGIAAWMGIFTLVLAVWTQRSDARAGVRRFAWAVLGLVVVQALIGGLRVRLVSDGVDATPTWAKIVHATIGQVWFVALAALATVLSPRFRSVRRRDLERKAMTLMRTAAVGTALLFVQTVLGALARHDALPREVHAFFALPVMVVVAKLVLEGSFDVPEDVPEIRRPAAFLGVLAAVQLVLGLITYFTATAGPAPELREAAQVVVINLHLAVGAAMLAACASIVLVAFRVWGAPTDERVLAARAAALPVPETAS